MAAIDTRFDALIPISIQVFEYVGTFVFALSGAALAATKKLDLFGVLVLAIAAGTAGGVIRDVLIGSVPPNALVAWQYAAVCAAAGLTVFFLRPDTEKLKRPILLLDAAGLALFSVVGTNIALASGLKEFGAALLGMITGIGGGMVRDMLVTETPAVLRSELYAVAALIGSVTTVYGPRAGLDQTVAAALGGALCFGLRLLAIFRGWRLPLAETPPS